MANTLRKITEADLENIMNWRMDPEITKMMYTDPVLTLEGQKKWLAAIEKRDNEKYFLLEVDGESAGVMQIVDIDWEKKTCGWGYYIGNKNCRSLRLALDLEWSMYDYVLLELGLDEVISEMLHINKGVIKLHETCGSTHMYTKENAVEKNGELYDVVFMHMTKEAWEAKKPSVKYTKIDFPNN